MTSEEILAEARTRCELEPEDKIYTAFQYHSTKVAAEALARDLTAARVQIKDLEKKLREWA